MAVLTNLTMFQSEDKIFALIVYQSDGVTVQNLTGWTLTFRIHVYGHPETVFVTKTIGSGIAVVSAAAGTITVTIAAADTAALNPDEYMWYLERTNVGSDTVTTVGLFTLLRR